jgi:hypothetical protein
MDDSHSVGVVDALQSLTEKTDGLVAGHRTGPADQAIEGLPANEFHHHEEVLALAEEAEEGGDVWMIQLCQSYCLGPKSLYDMWLACQFRAKHFYGYLTFEHQVYAFEHSPHSAFAYFFGYLIASYYIANH